MKRRKVAKILGLSAFAVSVSGFKLIEMNGVVSSDCATSRDMLGPYYRKGAPKRTDLFYEGNVGEIPLRVYGKIIGADCQKALSGIKIDIWHCDHDKKYDMNSDEFKCRALLHTDNEGGYFFKTFIPPPYEGRPKHIHYLIHESDEHQGLVTQLYFKGDKNIENYHWFGFPKDDKRILEVYKNSDGIAEVNLDLFIKQK